MRINFDILNDLLKDISFPNLQQLIIYDHYCPRLDVIEKIIEKTNGDLKKISIGICHNIYDNNSRIRMSMDSMSSMPENWQRARMDSFPARRWDV